MKKSILPLVLALFAALSGCRDSISPGPESLTDPYIKPRVIYASVVTDGGRYGGHILLRFNKIMDESSLRWSISLEAQAQNIRYDPSRLTSLGGDMFMVYAIDTNGYYYDFSNMKLGQWCVLRIDTTARDMNGNRLKPAYATTLVPEPIFRVTYVYPPHGRTNVSGDESVYIRFNSPVTSSVTSAISCRPATPGPWIISDYGDSTGIYFYAKWFSPNTVYQFSIDTSARDRFGNSMHDPYFWWFKTSPFEVWLESPRQSVVVDTNTFVQARATHPIDTASARQAFSITPYVSGNLVFPYWDSRSFEFYPSFGFNLNTTYTLTISTALRTAGGSNLPSPFTYTFRTEPFRVTQTIPANGQTNVGRARISVTTICNAEIDAQSTQGCFNISPPAAGTLVAYSGSSYFYYDVTSLLSANTTYTVTISTALRSSGGTALSEPYTFSFTTGN